jgi:hypothetical protein
MMNKEEFVALGRSRLLRSIALLTLFGWVAGSCLLSKYSVLELDVWWHLKVGDWILQHSSVPRTGILSGTAFDRPWMAYSWGYEVLLSYAYRFWGIVGIGYFGVALTVAVGVAMFWMLRRTSNRFWTPLLLTAASLYAFLFNVMPRPVFFSMLLFAVVLERLLEADSTGDGKKLLYWLPPLFVVWANLHIQFVYGLAMVGLFVAVHGASRFLQKLDLHPAQFRRSSIEVRWLLVTPAACALATCVGPYSYRLYSVILEYSRPHITYSMIGELQPLSFTSSMHYMQLFLTAAAFYAIGRQKQIDPFKLALMVLCTTVAYRTMRDSWFVCIPAAACIISSWSECPAREQERGKTAFLRLAATAVALLMLIFLLARNTDFDQRGLGRAISGKFPVDAANFVRGNPPPPPMYNNLDWGGFLTWYLPQYPVSIDGRNDLYGDQIDRRAFDTQFAIDYENDPELNRAGFALLKSHTPLAGALRSDRRFSLVYEDERAVIFVRR